MSITEKLLDVQHVTVEFHIGGLLGGSLLVAVNDISFSLDEDRPEIFTLAGESGSGKTTLSRLILRDLEPTRGKVLFEGRDLATIRKRSEFKEFMKKVQPVFQNPFETFSPLRRVDAYLVDTAVNFRMASNRREAVEVVDDALRNVGLSLEEVSRRYPHELSGGQVQRVSVARALISHPKLILADEPVSMVDASLRMSIMNLFRELVDRLGLGVVYITHDLATAYYVCDRIAIMFRGNIVSMGEVEDVLIEPKHPYVRLLRECIPDTDLKNRWRKKIQISENDAVEYMRGGCKFAGRCPQVMEVCKTEAPQDIIIDGALTKCHLWRNPS